MRVALFSNTLPGGAGYVEPSDFSKKNGDSPNTTNRMYGDNR